jgi:hypothetical protein
MENYKQYIENKEKYMNISISINNQEGGKKRIIYTLDNGYTGYKVEISNNIKIYKPLYDKDKNDGKIKDYKLIKTIESFESIFIGKSTDEIWCGCKEKLKNYIGNSILVKLSKYKYIHIGAEVTEFKIKEEIIRYESPVGPNGVPYPYAVGEKNTYFMEGEIVPNCELQYQMHPNNYVNGNYCCDCLQKYCSKNKKIKKDKTKPVERERFKVKYISGREFLYIKN